MGSIVTRRAQGGRREDDDGTRKHLACSSSRMGCEKQGQQVYYGQIGVDGDVGLY